MLSLFAVVCRWSKGGKTAIKDSGIKNQIKNGGKERRNQESNGFKRRKNLLALLSVFVPLQNTHQVK